MVIVIAVFSCVAVVGALGSIAAALAYWQLKVVSRDTIAQLMESNRDMARALAASAANSQPYPHLVHELEEVDAEDVARRIDPTFETVEADGVPYVVVKDPEAEKEIWKDPEGDEWERL